MAEDVLQQFLTSKLFDVGGDDTRLAHLRGAAEDLATKLKAEPERVPAFTMVAIDAETPPEEPIFSEVAKLLQNRWNSYGGAFVDKTLPVVFRGIILNALEQQVSNDGVAAAVTLTSRNLLPHLGARADAPHWKHLIDAASTRLEKRAQREWALPSTTIAKDRSLDLANTVVVAPTANKDWLQKRMRAAAGPTAGGEPTEGNPHWPSGNDPWVNEYGTRAGLAIGGSIDASAKALAENVSKALQPMRDTIAGYVEGAVGDVSQTALGLERRTSLLWWKEALYSPLAQSSYRQLNVPVAMAFVALDAFALTGAFAPRMAEAFLLETARVIDAETQVAVPLTALCESIRASPAELFGPLNAAFSKLHVEPGRTPLAGLLGSEDTLGTTEISKRTGLSEDFEISPADFALWLYRDLQASAAVPTPKPRKRKAS